VPVRSYLTMRARVPASHIMSKTLSHVLIARLLVRGVLGAAAAADT
jgi:hypothetical protein